MTPDDPAAAPETAPPKAKKAPKKAAKPAAAPKSGTAKKTAKAKAERTGSTTGTLIFAEKNIAARRIAAILSGDRAREDKIGKTPVYEFGDPNGELVSVVGLRGHIVTVDFPKKYNSWRAVQPRELIWAETEKRVDRDAKEIAAALKTLAKQVKRVIVATDYDREGELIGVEALDLVLQANPDVQVVRSRFSALTPDEVKRAFANLSPVDHNLANAAMARQVVDLAWGATLTRFISLSSGQIGNDFLSVGRVQTPTLALIVDREKEIKAFVPVPYFEVGATLDKSGERFPAAHAHGRFDSEEEAAAAQRRAQTADAGKVLSVETTERREKPPEPFSTTAFLRAATALGFGASKAMSVAENLYMSGWISYPRTDNTQYPPSLDLRAILQKFADKECFVTEDAKALLAKDELKPTAGKKTTTDHPPVHPTEVARHSDLTAEEWKVYELVVRRFLATLSDPAVSEAMRVRFDLGGEEFQSNGRRLVVPGFRKVYPYNKGEDVNLPALAEGERVPIVSVDLDKKFTKPPPRMSQGRLIQEMENLGLGTKSTRAEIISKLYNRDYVRNNPPEPTPTGFAVTAALEEHAHLITSPQMTSQLEREMDEVAEAQRQMDEVITDSRKLLEQVMDQLEANRQVVGGVIRQALAAKNRIGTCTKCNEGQLTILKGRTGKRFVGCNRWPECDRTYPLPQFGKITTLDTNCTVCGAPGIKIQNRGRPWITCLTMGCNGLKDWKPPKKGAAEGADGGEDAEGAEAPPTGEEGGAVPAEAVDPEDL